MCEAVCICNAAPGALDLSESLTLGGQCAHMSRSVWPPPFLCICIFIHTENGKRVLCETV